MKTLEELQRLRNLHISSTADDGGCGVIDYGKLYGTVVWSFGGGWEHVSVAPFSLFYTPTWSDMCKVKDMFFRGDEWVVQYHPAKSEYVNNVSNCLHLWRPINVELPTPPSIMVGVKPGQTVAEVKEAIRRLDE